MATGGDDLHESAAGRGGGSLLRLILFFSHSLLFSCLIARGCRFVVTFSGWTRDRRSFLLVREEERNGKRRKERTEPGVFCRWTCYEKATSTIKIPRGRSSLSGGVFVSFSVGHFLEPHFNF